MSLLSEKKLEILQQISNAIILSDNVSSIANIMLDLAIDHTGAEKGSLMLLDSRQRLSIFTSRGLDDRLARTYSVEVGEGIAGYVAQQRQSVLVANIDDDPRFNRTYDHYKTRSFISCPVIGKSQLLGVLNINDKKDGTPFTDDDLTLIQIIANQAAIALKNAFLVTQLKSKAAELEDVNRKLIETSVAKTEFLTRVSHELRTPLNSSKGAIYYLLNSERPRPEEDREFLGIISYEINKMIAIVENQLDFLRTEDESRILHSTIINLENALRETLESKMLQSRIARKDLRIHIRFPQDLPDVVGDKIMVAQLFINLMEGMIPFIPPSGEILFTASEDEHVVLTMQTSFRLPEGAAEAFFTSPNLLDPQKSDESLKLYLARKSAQAHHWKLDAANTDQGLRVSLVIPRRDRQRIDAAINTTMDLFLDFVSELLAVNTCSIMLSDDLTQDLVIRSARGLDDDVVKQTRIRPGDRIAGWVAQEGKPLLIRDIREDPRFSSSTLSDQYNTQSLLSLPLIIDGKTIGVINLNNKKSGDAFSETDLKVAQVLADRIASLIAQMKQDGHTEKDLKRIIASFDTLLSAKRRHPHAKMRNLDLTDRLLEKLGVDEDRKRLGLYISMVYDLGLALIDKSVLKKGRNLSKAELGSLRIHPYTTVDLLKDIEFSDDVREIILHHHERYDGQGYPDGLKGEQIPFLSRALSVVDAWCAMTEDRPYRKKLSEKKALQELKEKAGTQFDPDIVTAFTEMMESPP
ncbi:MAG: GAF domain-containing protein [Geoalkalibacter sp.]|uniref:GAF domain-containing protein n=1 Tax=Geoalkalibacter sp. TaxID=3041440 RepID=UPI003D0E19C7